MLVALSTIGPTYYEEVEYCWEPRGEEHRTYRTDLFPLTVDSFFQPEKILLMVTAKAYAHSNYRRIEHEIGARLQPILVPDGRTEEELWEIFDMVCEAVPVGSRLIMDVTHGFRSLPFVAFGIVNYLRRVKKAHLERIVYGAYDASEHGSDGVKRVPVFELTMLVDLGEWLEAVEAFTFRSEGDKLADLLREAHRRSWLSGTRDKSELPSRLQNMGASLRDFSRSVRFSRTLDALNAAHRAYRLVKQVEAEVARWAKPLGVVLAGIAEELAPLSGSEDDVQTLSGEELRRQLELIRHYIDKDLMVQAVLMEREWLVNWVAFRTREQQWRAREIRSKVESMLGTACRGQPTMSNAALPELRKAAELWSRVTSLRNDVAHCAMNEHPASPETIRQGVRKIAQDLETLPADSC